MHVKLCWVVFVDSSFVAACSEKRKNARTPKLCRGGVKFCRPHAATRHCQSNFGRQRSCSQQNLGARSQSLLTKVTARLPLRPMMPRGQRSLFSCWCCRCCWHGNGSDVYAGQQERATLLLFRLLRNLFAFWQLSPLKHFSGVSEDYWF